MELYAYVVNAQDKTPIAYATVQRQYPDGSPYSDPVVADAKGYFNGRVPGSDYHWYITAAGYAPRVVDLVNAVADGTATVTLDLADSANLEPVVVTGGTHKSISWLLVVAAAVGIAKYSKLI